MVTTEQTTNQMGDPLEQICSWNTVRDDFCAIIKGNSVFDCPGKKTMNFLREKKRAGGERLL